MAAATVAVDVVLGRAEVRPLATPRAEAYPEAAVPGVTVVLVGAAPGLAPTAVYLRVRFWSISAFLAASSYCFAV